MAEDKAQTSAFEKSKRLLTAKDYKAVFDAAQWKVSCRELLCLAKPNGFDSPRLGLIIAKKNVKLAVQRNRIKRIIRESFRLHQDQLPNGDLIILARQGLADLSNEELHQLMQKQWQRLNKKAQKKAQQSQNQTKTKSQANT